MSSKRVLLIIGGGIAAYKCLELIRRARDRGIAVRVVMTKAAQEFITPLSVGALTNDRVFTDLFDLNDEREIGHIRLSREADLIVVAPATADLLAKMAGGHAGDLATSVLMATDKPVLVAPAMNPRMWRHPATQRNTAQLEQDGILFVGPNVGEMAEANEGGRGRMAEPHEVLDAIEAQLDDQPKLLAGRHVLVTAGPTHEPIDPVRYIANRSSGTQGYAVAAAAQRLGADVTLISGPTNLPDPAMVEVIRIQSAREMFEAVEAALPADIGIFAAAVADWRVASQSDQKIKKNGNALPTLEFTENPDILQTIAKKKASKRPALVIGFAAETENVIKNAQAKLKKKQCDWIIANDVSPESGVMGGSHNAVHIVSKDGVESWPEADKASVAEKIVRKAAEELAAKPAAV
ncbi:MAG: bifunctional phosphopantothenoylcysteine decarboxylase/phosphopantothenate--cysteine ligase CoaBC [Pseudomonadota bacterium]